MIQTGKKTKNKPLFPMLVDLSAWKVVIIGGNTEAEKLARILAGYTDLPEVIAPDPCAGLEGMAEEGLALLRRKQYEREDIYGADLVIAASENAKINRDIYAACRCLGIKVYVCDDRTRCDFYFQEEPSENAQSIAAGSNDRTAGRTDGNTAMPEDAAASGDLAMAQSVRKKASHDSAPGENRSLAERFVRIYTDGAARGNPDGPGGYGTILEYTDAYGNVHTKEFSQGYKRTTNNRMELMAAIAGLEALRVPCTVELYSDSKYLVDAFNQHWIDSLMKNGWVKSNREAVKNISVWKRLLTAMQPHHVKFIWVKGHAGHPRNERCDELATTAADGDSLIEDTL